MNVQLTLMIAIPTLPVLIRLDPLHVPAMLNTREMAQRETVKNIVLQAGLIGLLGTRTGVRKKSFRKASLPFLSRETGTMLQVDRPTYSR